MFPRSNLSAILYERVLLVQEWRDTADTADLTYPHIAVYPIPARCWDQWKSTFFLFPA